MADLHAAEAELAPTERASAQQHGGHASAILPGERAQYPLHMAVDFTKLRTNALRKYMAFHRIPETPGSSREQMAITVARHFNEECKRADETSSIASFVTYLTGAKGDMESAVVDRLKARSVQRLKRKKLLDKENSNRQYSVMAEGPSDNEDDGLYEEQPSQPFTVKKRRPVTILGSEFAREKGGRGSSSNSGGALIQEPDAEAEGEGEAEPKKKKRKQRLYCVCKGSSFGNMIACDNKKCLDRSNWYHMSCVDLDPSKDPPETWFCPSCQEQDLSEIPENQYRKPVASVTYGDMISHALAVLPGGKGTFKQICDFVEKQYESQLNWKLESDQRKSPVWKSSVRKILFSNVRFRKHPEDKGLFCMAA